MFCNIIHFFVQEILLVFILICHSDQRPQLKADESNTTKTIDTDTATEPPKNIENISQATLQVTDGTAAVSIQTSIDVSPSDPSEIFDGFKPSNYYRPDGNPIFERPSPQVTHEVFYNPQYFRRPNNSLEPLLAPSKTDEKNIIFPQTPQEHNTDHDADHGPESRSPHNKFTKAKFLPAKHSKPMKHDYGEIVPSFSSYDPDLYERHFGKYHGKEMIPHYAGEVSHEPPSFYHSVVHKRYLS